MIDCYTFPVNLRIAGGQRSLKDDTAADFSDEEIGRRHPKDNQHQVARGAAGHAATVEATSGRMGLLFFWVCKSIIFLVG